MRVGVLIKCAVFGIGIFALTGCAKQQQTEVTGSTNAAAMPGSQQDFVVNVGNIACSFKLMRPSSPRRQGKLWTDKRFG